MSRQPCAKIGSMSSTSCNGAGALSRRQLLRMIGVAAGNAAMYQAMSSLGFAADSTYTGPDRFAGRAERRVGADIGRRHRGHDGRLRIAQRRLSVEILEYNTRAGGRNWSLRGGDTLHGTRRDTQECRFDKDLYINPGPWRLPVPPPRHPQLLQTPGRAARGIRAGQLQRLPAQQQGHSAASRSAIAKSRPTIRARWRSCSPRRRGSTRSMTWSARRIRKNCSNRCAAGAPSTRTSPMSASQASSKRRGFKKPRGAA
jgi:hypothetical protein